MKSLFGFALRARVSYNTIVCGDDGEPMLMLLPKRIALIFYRASTYQRLAKVLFILAYVAGLSLFFGLFIAKDSEFTRAASYPEPTRPAAVAHSTQPVPAPSTSTEEAATGEPQDAGETDLAAATDASPEGEPTQASPAGPSAAESPSAETAPAETRDARILQQADQLMRRHGMDPEDREKLLELLTPPHRDKP